MPYDATVEIDEFRFMDTRDRPERDYREREPVQRRPDPVERIAAVVNDPEVILTPELVKIVNNPDLVMDRNGEVMKRLPSPRGFQSRTRQRPILYPPLKSKRTRKKTKMDKTMSKCLKIANQKLRNKNGKLKKGKSMRDVMKMAHRLCRKENGTKKGMARKTARRAYEN